LKCPKCSEKISKVDTFCPSCGEFLKSQKFEREEKDRSSYQADLKAAKKQAAEKAVVVCPKCGQQLSIPKHNTALMVSCPRCKNTFRHNF